MMDNEIANAYSVLGIDENTSIDEIKSKYKTLAKKYHPDITNEENEHIRIINSSYKLVVESYYRKNTPLPKHEKEEKEYIYAFIVKGTRLAMKQYVEGLMVAKIKGDFRAEKLEEICVLLSCLENIEEEKRTSLYYTLTLFLRYIIDFEMTTIYIKAENALERKASAIYIQMMKDITIALEEIFARLDSTKKMTSLWKDYIGRVIEEYKTLVTTGVEKYISASFFVPDFMSVIKDMYSECKKDSVLITYKDFYELFEREKKNKVL